MKLKSEFLKEIYSRGFIYQSSDIENLDSLIHELGHAIGIGHVLNKRDVMYPYAVEIK